MDNPLYDVDIIVGGSATQYTANKILGERIHAGQSFDLEYTFLKSDASAFSVAGATATLRVSAYKGSGYTPVLLVSGVPSDSGHGGGFNDRFTFTVPEDTIPSDIAAFPLRTPGNAIFYAVITDGAGKKIEVVAEVNIYDDDYSLTGEAAPSDRVIIPKGNDLGTVENLTTTVPPTPTLNVAYIVGPSATGDWAGQDDDLAIGTGTAWVFLTPVEGNFVYDKATDLQYVFDTSWTALGDPVYADGEFIADNNGNELLEFGVVGSAVNHLKDTNAITATNPKLSAVGSDANIGLELEAKGTGTIKANNTVQWANGADVASATALPVLNDGNYFDVTGTTTVTSINSLGVGTEIKLHFDGILTLTHNATDLILPTGANITTAAGDIAIFHEYATGDYRCINYSRADGTALVGGGGGNFPTSTDSGDKTTAYSIVAGDENTTIVAGTATSADFTITYDVSVWTTAGSCVTVRNESSYIVKIVVSNTGTMQIDQGIDKFIGPGETITMAADTSTQVWSVART